MADVKRKVLFQDTFVVRAAQVIVVKLREAMEAHRRRTGQRMTYERLADLTGIAHSTLRSIGSRLGYRPTLANVEKLCHTLEVPLHDLLELIDDPPKAKRTGRKKKRAR